MGIVTLALDLRALMMIHGLWVFILTSLSVYSQVLGDGSCIVVPKEEAWSDYQVARITTGRARKYWCQVNCPAHNSLTDGKAICPFFDPSVAAANCSDFSVSQASSCNQG